MSMRAAVFFLGMTLSSLAVSSPLGERLDDALALAPEAQVLTSEQDIQQASQAAATRWFPEPPQLSLSGRTDRWQDDLGRRDWEVAVSSPLWRAGQRQARTLAAAADTRRWDTEQQAFRLKLAGELRESVWNLAERNARLQNAEERVRLAELMEHDVARRVSAGDLARTDLLLAQSETLAARNRRDDVQQQCIESRQSLLLLTGQNALPAVFEETLANRPEITDLIHTHPLLIAARQSVAAARAQLQSARKDQAAPSAAIHWTQEREAYDQANHETLGLTLSAPIGAAQHNRLAIATANSRLVSAEARLQRTRREITEQINTAHAQWVLATHQRDLTARQSALLDQSISLSRRRFEAGELDLLSQLKLQNNLMDALENRDEKAIAYKRAIARYNQALGLLP